jgi:ribonuclease HI
MKVNVDGAVSRDKTLGSIATVVQNHEGQSMGSSAVVFPSISDPKTFESLACKEALSIAQDLKFSENCSFV